MAKSSTSLAPTDWFETACEILKTQGHHRVTLRGLCAALGLSTGSFYDHFKHRGDFVERLFDYWAERGREAVKDLIADGPANLNDINRDVNKLLDHRLEAAMRAWGLFDDSVADKIMAVDNARRKFFREYYGDRLDPAIANEVVNLHLCSLAGAQFMFLDKPTVLNRFGAFVNRVAESLAKA